MIGKPGVLTHLPSHFENSPFCVYSRKWRVHRVWTQLLSCFTPHQKTSSTVASALRLTKNEKTKAGDVEAVKCAWLRGCNGVRTLDGFFQDKHRIGLLIFDDLEQAKKYEESTLKYRDAQSFGGIELFRVPLALPVLSIRSTQLWSLAEKTDNVSFMPLPPNSFPPSPPQPTGTQFCQIDFYSVRSTESFTKFLLKYNEMVRESGGVMVAGSSQYGTWMKESQPTFICMVQWNRVSEFEDCFMKGKYISGLPPKKVLNMLSVVGA
ncbi:unnamed protein product [Protopolystoma xenopodis]|uniref:Uncharacterized protein n=1 Tax=Protopolystoma xenopodis TaxID=117903 RepID=A0A3S5B1E8_9PLAT|nr:unnamed protein product [Protopolystoma xenopodis]